jgi:hypothetical protein
MQEDTIMTQAKFRVIAAAALSATLSASVTHAIVWGEPDGDNHPNVGALFIRFDPVFAIAPGVPAGILPVCSGSVIAKQGNRALFLTAGHCLGPLAGGLAAFAALNPSVVVSFSGNLHDDLGTMIPVDMDALYSQLLATTPPIGAFPDRDDVGILVLEAEEESHVPEPVTLPWPGLLDALGSSGFRQSVLRIVGFGDDIAPPRPNARVRVFGTRQVAHPNPVNLGERYLMAQQNGHAGYSGAYYGDSGGPVFWVDPTSGDETLVAIVNGPVGNVTNDVAVVGQHYRIDTVNALAFIDSVRFAEGF